MPNTTQVDSIFEIFKKATRPIIDDSKRLYTKKLLMWLMIHQRLAGDTTLRAAVEHAGMWGLTELMGNCKRRRERQLSRNTSAYAQARLGLPLEDVEEVSDEIFAILNSEDRTWHGRHVVAVDGTTVKLAAKGALRKAFPGASNQHGESRYPVLQLGVAHDLMTGCAYRPEWGAMYGAARVSEPELCKRLLARFEQPVLMVGDRNFGIFQVCHAAASQGHQTLVRLTEKRAQKICKKSLTNGFDKAVCWSCSKEDRKHAPELKSDDAIDGRLIVQDVIGADKKKQRLYLFTTVMEVEVRDLVALYARRWEIETDLRHLKKVINLDSLSGQSVNVVENELVLAVVAYNLVRATALMAAVNTDIDPKRISFTAVYSLIRIYGLSMLLTKSRKEQEHLMNFILDSARYRVNPKRKPRHYPRAAFKKPTSFAIRSTILPKKT